MAFLGIFMPIERTNASISSLLKKYFQIDLKAYQKKNPIVLSMLANVLGADLFMLVIFHTEKGYESFQLTNFEGLEIKTERLMVDDIYSFLNIKKEFVEQFNRSLYYTLVDNFDVIQEKALILVEKITLNQQIKDNFISSSSHKI